MKRKTKEKKPPTYQELLEFYDACLRENSNAGIVARLGWDPKMLWHRLQKWEEFRFAKKMADENREKTLSLSSYIFEHLSKESQEIWEKIQFWKDSTSAYEKINAILSGRTKKVRQELFIHALVTNHFDATTACKLVSIPYTQLLDWKKDDLEFRQLIEEIHWHKKNFFESSLVNLVEGGSEKAILFVNRTLNSDRGYTEKLEVKNTSKEQDFRLEDLKLSIEVKKEILNAMRLAKEQKQLEDKRKEFQYNAIDVEAEPVAVVR
jgi:hypothetical protein